MTRQNGSRRVAVFLVLVTILTVIASLLNARGAFGHAGSLFYMWCPGIAALVASFITTRPLKAIGWTFSPRWIGLGWLIPVSYAFVGYGLVWITGLGGVPSDTFITRARLTLGLASQPPWLVIVAAFGYIAVLSVLPSMISSLGEEIGWRGFLVPELARWIGPRGACLGSGLIWATWHLPVILFAGYGAVGTPKAWQITCFFAMVMSSAVVMGWLRLKSGSIWPTAVVHATHNAVIQLFFDHITAPRAYTAWFIGEFGCALLLPLSLMAWYCWRDLQNSAVVESRGSLRLGPAERLGGA